MKNYYQILQVSENASSEVIEKAYKVLAKKYHPDLQSGDIKSRLAEGVFKEITEAYEVLSDRVLREQYDKQIGLIPNYNNFTHINPNTKSNFKTNKSSKYRKEQIEKFSIKDLITIISNAIHNQANKPKDERRRDLIALILTLIVVAILVIIVLNVPLLKNFFFK